MIQNCLLHKDLKVWTATFFHKMFVFLFNLKKYYWKSKIQFFSNNMWNNNETGLISNLSINIQILLMFLVGFRAQKKCNSKFHVFKRFDSDWSPHQWEFISIKNTKEETEKLPVWRISIVVKNDIKELQVWKYKIGQVTKFAEK